MATKTLYIEEQLHRRVKVTATLRGMTIKEWVEEVLTDALDGVPSASVLVDTRQRYSIGADYGPAGESCPD